MSSIGVRRSLAACARCLSHMLHKLLIQCGGVGQALSPVFAGFLQLLVYLRVIALPTR